jgi:hypothetical protein
MLNNAHPKAPNIAEALPPPGAGAFEDKEFK